MEFRLNEEREVAAWFIRARGKRVARETLRRQFFKDMLEHGVVYGPIRFEVLMPDHQRAPAMPKDAPRTLRLMLATAEVIGFEPRQHGFLTELEDRDLLSLRRATREAHARAWPGSRMPSDAECDEMIAELGPDVARKKTLH